MRFDELILMAGEDELRLRFHDHLTLLCGLGAEERTAFADGLLGALTGASDRSALRYVDGDGNPVAVVAEEGHVSARLPDGSTVAPPLGTIAPDAAALRSLMLLHEDDLGVLDRRKREAEPPELREARDMLEELTAALAAARGQAEAVESLQRQIDEVDGEIRTARDGLARREYAHALARLDAARAELAALQSGADAVEADRALLGHAERVRGLVAHWTTTRDRVAELVEAMDGRARIDEAERDRLVGVPDTCPDEIDALVSELERANDERAALDRRLQDLSVSRLPAPSDPAVAALGVLDQDALWHGAKRLQEAADAVQRVQVSLGGLELEEIQSATALVDAIEATHAELEEAERAAAAARTAGLAGTGLGVTLGLVGVAAAPLLVPVGLVGAVVAAGAGIVRPRARSAKAAKAEQEALEQADATSYLGFHIRRVEATIDPKLRQVVETTVLEHRTAEEAWRSLVGEVSLDTAQSLAEEIRSYHHALQSLGETAEEIEALRRQLDDDVEPAARAAYAALADACAPYRLPDGALGARPSELRAQILEQCNRGVAARAQAALEHAEAAEEQARAELGELLTELGASYGPVDVRVEWFDQSVVEATEREDARRRARPQAEIEAEVAALNATAESLRRPEWGAVTAAEAALPDIPQLEARRGELVDQLSAARAEVDVERLADRHAALERRVAALEVRFGGADGSGDPGAIADIQQHLLSHLAKASRAAPHGDPVPVILDEVFVRVPADRRWDLLDLLHRLSEEHQLVYLSDDAFVAAWARQRALDGRVTLFEPSPAEG